MAGPILVRRVMVGTKGEVSLARKSFCIAKTRLESRNIFKELFLRDLYGVRSWYYLSQIKYTSIIQ